jgi:broad specificity phosphatase PhoE
MESEIIIQEQYIKGKPIFLVRHGERVDKVGLTPQVHEDDSEITELGKLQAEESGQIISEILEKFKNEQNILDNKRILIFASPFFRTLQTAVSLRKSIQKCLKMDNIEIRIENKIGELMLRKLFGENEAENFLASYTNHKLYREEFEDCNLIPDPNWTNTLTKLGEYNNDAQQRMVKIVKEKCKENFVDNNYDCLIFVSHAGVIDGFNSEFNKKRKKGGAWTVKYCHVYAYHYNNKVDEEDEEFVFLEEKIPSLTKK